MKYIKLALLSLALVFILPIRVFAQEPVKIYFFRGEGCSHCAETEEWFSSIQEQYGEKYTIIDYETWYDEENSNLMQKVAAARGEEDKATGVPYLIIGDKSWVGFSKDSMADEILAQIDAEYEKDPSERYDVMTLLDGSTTTDKKGNDVLALIIILLVVGGVCFGVYKARNTVN